jgi:hypothetical protein
MERTIACIGFAEAAMVLAGSRDAPGVEAGADDRFTAEWQGAIGGPGLAPRRKLQDESETIPALRKSKAA